jgi:hypothetical protein
MEFRTVSQELRRLALRCLFWFGLGRRRPALKIVRADELPDPPLQGVLYIIGERNEDWFAALVCPCRCGSLIELNLVPPGRPCWMLNEGAEGPTLFPSVWRKTGCRSHFWVRDGRIAWAGDEDLAASIGTPGRERLER